MQQKPIDRKIEMMLSFTCCMIRNRNEVFALDAIRLHSKIYEKGFSIASVSQSSGIDIYYLYETMFGTRSMTIGDAMTLKEVLALTDEEAIDIFLRGDTA